MILFLLIVYYAPLLLSTLKISMEPVNLGYSTKNIPIAKPAEYLTCLIDKTDSFLRRVRWKAYHFLNPTKSDKTKTFGFLTTKSPPPIKELDEFEEKCPSSFKTFNSRTTNPISRNNYHETRQKSRQTTRCLFPLTRQITFIA